MRRLAWLGFLVALGAAVFGAAAPAGAGGSWLDTDQPRYEPGDEVTAVGYSSGGQYGGVDDGPFHAWLTGNSSWTDEVTDVDPDFLHYLGPLIIHEAAAGYPRYRLSITFTLPENLVDGIYGLHYCNAACDEQFGDLIGGTVYVGAGQGEGRPPHWAPWEPLLTGDPLPSDMARVGEIPDPGFVPPPPADIWGTGTVATPQSPKPTAPSPTTTASVARPTNVSTPATVTTTVPTTTTTTLPADEELRRPRRAGWGAGALILAVLAIAGVRKRRFSRVRN